MRNFYLLSERDDHLNLNDPKPYVQPSPLSPLAFNQAQGARKHERCWPVCTIGFCSGSCCGGAYCFEPKASEPPVPKPLSPLSFSSTEGTWSNKDRYPSLQWEAVLTYETGRFSLLILMRSTTSTAYLFWPQQTDCLQGCFQHLVLHQVFIQGRDTLVLIFKMFFITLCFKSKGKMRLILKRCNPEGWQGFADWVGEVPPVPFDPTPVCENHTERAEFQQYLSQQGREEGREGRSVYSDYIFTACRGLLFSFEAYSGTVSFLSLCSRSEPTITWC